MKISFRDGVNYIHADSDCEWPRHEVLVVTASGPNNGHSYLNFSNVTIEDADVDTLLDALENWRQIRLFDPKYKFLLEIRDSAEDALRNLGDTPDEIANYFFESGIRCPVIVPTTGWRNLLLDFLRSVTNVPWKFPPAMDGCVTAGGKEFPVCVDLPKPVRAFARSFELDCYGFLYESDGEKEKHSPLDR